MYRFLLSGFVLLYALAANAQVSRVIYVEDATIKAYNGNFEKQLAWCGGFNNPQFTMGDINNDQVADLVVYDYHSNQIKTFLNMGTPGAPNYVYAPKYQANFPAPNNYLILADYNRDGIADAINKGAGGYRVHKGYFNAKNELCFTVFKELRYKSDPGNTINANSNGGDIPTIADIDGDGDLDFISFNEGGAILYFFKNCQVEHGLPKDSIDICKPTNCWGYVNQGNVRKYTTSITLGDPLYCPNYFNYDCRGTLHGGNTACVVDIDGDGDYDFLGGNFAFNDLQLLINGKAQYGSKDSIVAQDTIWKNFEMSSWPAAFNIDVDGDGKKDILVSPHAVGVSENYRNIAYFRNTGTLTAPVFTYQTDTFLQDQGIDVGSSSYPFLYDYNRDGKPDLFVGSAGYFQNTGVFRSKIAYYKNTKVGNETRMVLQTTDFNNIFAENVEGAAPAFGDLDNDGKDDMVVGHADGTLTFYRNVSPTNVVQPVFAPGVLLKDDLGADVRIQNNAIPFLYDINNDGKKDLLIGSQIATIGLYTNTGNTGVLRLTRTTDTLGGMRSQTSGLFGFSSIYVGRMDSSATQYILLGNANGTFRRYGGFQSGNINMNYQLLDDNYSGIDVGDRSTPAIADLNGDGRFELISGNLLGGLNQYTQVLDAGTGTGYGGSKNSGSCNIYPNPASDKLYITWDQAFASNEEVNVQLINITGQSIAKNSISGNKLMTMINVSDYPAGIYVCLVQAGNNVLSQRVFIGK